MYNVVYVYVYVYNYALYTNYTPKAIGNNILKYNIYSIILTSKLN